jgi:hypothetical protein
MILDLLDNINWLAVLVAALAWFVSSAIYFARPVMGNAWARAAGVQVSQGQRPAPINLILTIIVFFLAALGLALVARAVGAATFLDGLVLGVVASLAFSFSSTVAAAQFEERNAAYQFIHGLNSLIGYSIMAVIVTLWD